MDERFWRKVNKTGSCWLWTGAHLAHGYGQVRRNKLGILAHRYSWMLRHGPIPDGLNVLHKCDVRACVNPEHLFLGTQKQNVDDMLRKGRESHVAKAPGVRNGNVKLTEADVARMRALYRCGYTYERLAVEFGVSFAQAGRIVKREAWKHVVA